MSDPLPILQVTVPLAAAPLCLLLRLRPLVWPLALATVWTAAGIAVTLLLRVLSGESFEYFIGGWAAPYGIEYRVDPLTALVLVFVSGVGALVLSFAPRSLARELPPGREHLFLAVYLLCLTGLLGIVVTGDLFNLFVFLEISSLASYTLIALGRDRRALTAAFQYLVMGTIGATFILIGIGLLYTMTGTLNMEDMAVRLGGVDDPRAVIVAFAFFTVGVALKMALFPLHLWLPDAYAFAPSVSSAFLAGTSTKVSVYILLRFVFTVFGHRFAFETVPLDRVLVPLALAAIIIPSLVAVFQNDVKRMLAYSSLAQIGYIVLGIGCASVTGLTAAITHLFNHALMKTALFLALGAVIYRVGSSRLEALRGLGRRMPLTMLLWTLAGLGLVGLPATVGFVSKWYLVLAAAERNWWWAVALILASSLVALIYVWRVVECAWFQPAEGESLEAPASMLWPITALVVATIVFGIWTPLTAGAARHAASYLFQTAPAGLGPAAGAPPAEPGEAAAARGREGS